MSKLLATVGDCKKVVRENGAKECPNGGTHNGMYNDIILEKGERSWADGSYAEFTRKGVKRPLRKNIIIIS